MSRSSHTSADLQLPSSCYNVSLVAAGRVLSTVTPQRWTSECMYTQLCSLCAGIVLQNLMLFADKKIFEVRSDVYTAHRLC